MQQHQFYESNMMDVLINKAFKYAQSNNLLRNLRGYQHYDSSSQYLKLMFPLLQNEFYVQLEREQTRYQENLEDEMSYPLLYKIQINQAHDIYAENSLRIDLLREWANIPLPRYNRNCERMWKYQHFVKYLIFRDANSYFVALYIKNQQNHRVQSVLGYYQQKDGECSLQIPIKNASIKFLISAYDLEEEFGNISRISYDQILQQMQEQNFLYLQPIGSPSPYKNEAQAILSISQCPYSNLILSPSNENNTVDQTPFGLAIQANKNQYFANDLFRNHFDDDQMNAIEHAVDFSKKITIIKGPPGTGKTRTIIGIIAILAELLRPDHEGIKGSILILAKSNSVVNDLIRKINQQLNQPSSLIYNFEQRPNFLKMISTGRAEKCERDIQPFNLEMKSQHQFFIYRFARAFEDIYSQYITFQLRERLVEIGILENTNQSLLRQNNQCFSLQVLLDLIGNVNFRTRDSNILDPLGNYYAKLKRLLKDNESTFKEIQIQQLQECHIVVTTLNSCSHQYLQEYFNGVKFRMCIVDEAPTALEPSLLIPLVKYQQIEKIVLLGDVEQLNPITISRQSVNYGYDRSLFQRLSSTLRNSTFELRYQYRQVPNLAEITSIMFYNGSLLNGIAQFEYPAYISSKVLPSRNRLFFNTPQGTENQLETSRRNNLECNAIVHLVYYLLQNNPSMNRKITIISAYRAQKDYIQTAIRAVNLLEKVELDTVDSFQGRENDIIILSLVRSDNQTGFLSDKKRTNVALSRARFCQFIFGTRRTMHRNRYNWRRVLNLLTEHNEIINYNEENLQNHQFYRSQLHPEQQ